eukprot:GFKZ01009619.1.p3 GENE.GFKZ01009619.1~~GFKZ01009619.1.p3  ORF type:complete len:110 (+),score=3.46 GFKZ01009619.1:140-469(+)
MRPSKQTRAGGNGGDERLNGHRDTSTAIITSSFKSLRGSSRPSMTYSTGSTRRPDPLLLYNKQHMQHCVKNLISYVIDHGYEHPISPKILTNLTSRDFQYIFLFLVERD